MPLKRDFRIKENDMLQKMGVKIIITSVIFLACLQIKAEYKKPNARLSNYVIELPANMVGELVIHLSSEDVETHNGETVNPVFGSVRLNPGLNKIVVQINSF